MTAVAPPAPRTAAAAGLPYNKHLSAYNESMEGTKVKVSRNGQVSVPAAVRHRWGTATVLIIDRGDYAIVRPVPDDPIGTLRGAYRAAGPSSDVVRARERAADMATEDRRLASS